MTLAKWVELNGGPGPVSQMLGTTQGAVYKWLTGGNLPRAPLLQAIFKLSKGRVSYRTMVEGALEVSNAKKHK